jgi:hypothetical protein
MSLTMNTAPFLGRFNALVDGSMMNSAESAMFRVGAMVIKDGIKVQPRAPHKTGRLWRSQQILTDPGMASTEKSVIVGFNTVYAAYLHECGSPGWRWTLRGSGPKYLSSKLVMFRLKYMRAAADMIKSDLELNRLISREEAMARAFEEWARAQNEGAGGD